MNESQLAEAIRSKSVVRFTYSHKQRVVHPHSLGYDRDGDLTLSAWEISPGDERSQPKWKRYHVAKITSLSIGPDKFVRARPDYKGPPSDLERVIARL